MAASTRTVAATRAGQSAVVTETKPTKAYVVAQPVVLTEGSTTPVVAGAATAKAMILA